MERDGDNSQPLSVYLDQGGVGLSPYQYILSTSGDGNVAPGSPITIPAYSSYVAVTITATDDAIRESMQDVTITIEPDANYTVGTLSTADLNILENDSDSPSPIVISQIYAAGGETDALFEHDFIELFNRSSSAVNLDNWSVQYADAESGTWSVIELSGTLDPGQYYLIEADSAGTDGDALPTPDLSSLIALAPEAGKVALATNTTAVSGAAPLMHDLADLVGYGEADWFEGTEGTAPATDFKTAAFRLGNGNYDTDNNAWDFYADEPNPRNTDSDIGNLKPVVTMPDELETALNTTLTFSTLASTAIAITDPDADTESLEITLDASNGTLTLAGTTGLTFTEGDGTDDAKIIFTGNLTNIAAALDGLTYSPEEDYRGGGSVTVWADDQGNTGAGSALFEYAMTWIVIDGPVVAVGDDVETLEDTPPTGFKLATSCTAIKVPSPIATCTIRSLRKLSLNSLVSSVATALLNSHSRTSSVSILLT